MLHNSGTSPFSMMFSETRGPDNAVRASCLVGLALSARTFDLHIYIYVYTTPSLMDTISVAETYETACEMLFTASAR